MEAQQQVFVREAVVTYRRHRGVPLPKGETSVANDSVAAELLRALIPDGPAERFVVVALDTGGRPQAWATIGMGGLASPSRQPPSCASSSSPAARGSSAGTTTRATGLTRRLTTSCSRRSSKAPPPRSGSSSSTT